MLEPTPPHAISLDAAIEDLVAKAREAGISDETIALQLEEAVEALREGLT